MTLARSLACLIVYLMILLAGCSRGGAQENNEGVSLYNRANYAQALQAFQSAQVAAYDEANYYFNAGNAYTELGDFDQAIAAFTQALKTADAEMEARIYYNIGNVYYALQRYNDAIAAYQQTLLRNPNDDDARHNLELALQHNPPETQFPEASPTSESMQDVGTPTPNDEQGDNPIPTQELLTGSPDENSESPAQENTLSPQDAQRILDGVQQNQQLLQQYMQTPSVDSTGKDW